MAATLNLSLPGGRVWRLFGLIDERLQPAVANYGAAQPQSA